MSEWWDNPLDALFVSPHPDDVELFCGGTVARLADIGYRVAIVDLTAGELASNGDVQTRRQESLDAAALLGVLMPRPVLGLPDGGVRGDDPDQVARLVTCLREAKPRLLFAPHPKDRHPDHVAAGHLCRRAVFLAALRRYGTGDPHRVASLVEYPAHHVMDPTFAVDVSAHMDRRRRAIAAYASQFTRQEGDRETPINQPTFLTDREAQLSKWGHDAGVAFAEGFLADVIPRLDDPFLQLSSNPSG